jgi:type I restriction enzyme S subunit
MDIEVLKQKILDLAIRGKLVPQDPSDEPASVLIEKIKAEKAKLIKEGKIKASKDDSYIYKGSDNCYYEKKENETINISDEIPFDIPSSWVWTRLKNIGEVIGGGTPSTSIKEYWDNGDIVWVTPAYMSSLNSNYVSDSYRKITKLGLEKSSAKLMPKGSIIMSSRAPIGYIAINTIEACTSQGCKSLVPYLLETNEFLLYVIKASITRIVEASKGTTFDEISGTQFGEVLVPLAPLKEQLKICRVINDSYKNVKEISVNYSCIKDYVNIAKRKILDLIFGSDSSYKSYYENYAKLSDSISLVSTHNKELKSRDVKSFGTIPVVSQSKQLVDGYSNDTSKMIRDIPAIIFGDHTRVVKYIDFEFIPGADGTKIIKSNIVSIKYLYYYILFASSIIEDRGYNRHFSLLKNMLIPIPKIEIQNKIVNYIESCFKILKGIN